MKRYHIIVSGLVQGVGFRFFVYELALKFKLAGWVQNLYDGTVEIEVQGNQDILFAFIDELKEGNMFSSVDDVSVEPMEVKEKEKSFRYMN